MLINPIKLMLAVELPAEDDSDYLGKWITINQTGAWYCYQQQTAPGGQRKLWLSKKRRL